MWFDLLDLLYLFTHTIYLIASFLQEYTYWHVLPLLLRVPCQEIVELKTSRMMDNAVVMFDHLAMTVRS